MKYKYKCKHPSKFGRRVISKGDIIETKVKMSPVQFEEVKEEKKKKIKIKKNK